MRQQLISYICKRFEYNLFKSIKKHEYSPEYEFLVIEYPLQLLMIYVSETFVSIH